MEQKAKHVSAAQRRAQKKYDQKTITKSIKYTPVDMQDYYVLEKYLKKTGQNFNGFVKKIIKEVINNQRPHIVWDSKFDEKINETQEYFPYYYIEEENLKFLEENFGEKAWRELLDSFYEYVEDAVDSAEWYYGSEFNNWVEELISQKKDEELGNPDVLEDEDLKRISDMTFEDLKESFDVGMGADPE